MKIVQNTRYEQYATKSIYIVVARTCQCQDTAEEVDLDLDFVVSCCSELPRPSGYRQQLCELWRLVL